MNNDIATTQKDVRNFLLIGKTEGYSFLILLFIAMPLKYLAGYPLAVRLVGSLHGIFFIAFMVTLFILVKKNRISLENATYAFLYRWYHSALSIWTDWWNNGWLSFFCKKNYKLLWSNFVLIFFYGMQLNFWKLHKNKPTNQKPDYEHNHRSDKRQKHTIMKHPAKTAQYPRYLCRLFLTHPFSPHYIDEIIGRLDSACILHILPNMP